MCRDSEIKKDHLKALLATTLIRHIRSKKWNQSEAAEVLEVTQPRISNLMRGKIDRFSVDSLMEMLFRVGYSFEYHIVINDE